MRVRLACHRCGSNGDAVAIAEFAAERVSTRLRLDPQAQHEVLAVPKVPGAVLHQYQKAETQPGAPTSCITGGTTSISTR